LEAQEKWKNVCARLEAEMPNFEKGARLAEERSRYTGVEDPFAVQLKRWKSQLEEAKQAAKAVDRHSTKALNIACETMNTKIQTLKTEARKLKIQQDETAHLLHEEIQTDLDSISVASFRNEHDRENDECNELEEHIQNALAGIQACTQLSSVLRQRAASAKACAQKFGSAQEAKDFYSVTLLPLEQECRKYAEQFADLNVQYHALCAVNGSIPAEIEEEDDPVEFLKEQIQRAQAQAQEAAEQAYISECLDNVMEEMGYDLVGERDVRKKSGKHFHNALYSFSSGTAVSVTYDSDGKISMELGGLDTQDRLPSRGEARQLCGEMTAFCDSFAEIERRLKEKGVEVRETISRLPPSEEYAQIINIEDYDMVCNAQEEPCQSVEQAQPQAMERE
jgi:hypothetical protein